LQDHEGMLPLRGSGMPDISFSGWSGRIVIKKSALDPWSHHVATPGFGWNDDLELSALIVLSTKGKKMLKQRPNPIAEGFTVALIYVVVAAVIVIAATVWQTGDWSNFYARTDIAGLLGRLTGNLILLGSVLAAVIGYRYASNVVKNIFLDWRFWVAFVLVGSLPPKQGLGWIWVSLIYGYRENRRQSSQLHG
jgi:hypothetical protein